MANNCYFEMKIAGEEPAVQEFIQMLQRKGEFTNNGLGRVFSFDILNPDHPERDPVSGGIALVGAGDCAWSIKSALQDWEPRNLMSETERLGLVVEAYSSEPGLCFQEHVLCDKGKMIIEDCVDYEEHWIEGADEMYIQEVMEEKGLTREELMSKLNHNGDYTEGGFEDFGEFDDLFKYLELSRKPALDAVISDAGARASGQNVPQKDREYVKE